MKIMYINVEHLFLIDFIFPPYCLTKETLPLKNAENHYKLVADPLKYLLCTTLYTVLKTIKIIIYLHFHHN